MAERAVRSGTERGSSATPDADPIDKQPKIMQAQLSARHVRGEFGSRLTSNLLWGTGSRSAVARCRHLPYEALHRQAADSRRIAACEDGEVMSEADPQHAISQLTRASSACMQSYCDRDALPSRIIAKGSSIVLQPQPYLLSKSRATLIHKQKVAEAEFAFHLLPALVP